MGCLTRRIRNDVGGAGGDTFVWYESITRVAARMRKVSHHKFVPMNVATSRPAFAGSPR